MMQTIISRAGLLMIGVLLLAGCSSTPLYRADNFTPAEMDNLYILPVMDARMVRKPELPSNAILQELTAKHLKSMHYASVGVASSPEIAGMTSQQIGQASADWIATLGPKEARWIMVAVVDRLERSFFLLGVKSTAEVSLFVFDKKAKALVWRDKRVREYDETVLLAGSKEPEIQSVGQAIVQMIVYKFPKR